MVEYRELFFQNLYIDLKNALHLSTYEKSMILAKLIQHVEDSFYLQKFPIMETRDLLRKEIKAFTVYHEDHGHFLKQERDDALSVVDRYFPAPDFKVVSKYNFLSED